MRVRQGVKLRRLTVWSCCRAAGHALDLGAVGVGLEEGAVGGPAVAWRDLRLLQQLEWRLPR